MKEIVIRVVNVPGLVWLDWTQVTNWSGLVGLDPGY